MFPQSFVVALNLLLLASTSEAKFKITPRIMGGETAAVAEFPYIVSIRDAKVDQHFCGGAMITPKNVLSAGHCLIARRLQPNSVYIALGVYNRRDGGVRKNIIQIAIHPEFNTTFMHNDISIITTFTKIEYTDHIQPIALPINDVPEKGDLTAVASGWGRIVSF